MADFLLFSGTFRYLAVELFSFSLQAIKTLFEICVVSLLLFDGLGTFFELSFPLSYELFHALNLRLQEVLLVKLFLLILTVKVLLLVFFLSNRAREGRIPLLDFISVFLHLFEALLKRLHLVFLILLLLLSFLELQTFIA